MPIVIRTTDKAEPTSPLSFAVANVSAVDAAGCLATVTVSVTDPGGHVVIQPPAPAAPVAVYSFTVYVVKEPTAPVSIPLTINWQGVGQPDPLVCGTDAEVNNLTLNIVPPARAAQNLDNRGEMPVDPVNSFTGEIYEAEPADLDLGGPLPLIFARYYGASLADDPSIPVSALGPNWRHSYDVHLTDNLYTVEVVTERGRVVEFSRESTGALVLVRPKGIPYRLVAAGGGHVLLDPLRHLRYTFDPSGRLTSIEDDPGNVHSVSYAGGLIDQVGDGLGRTLAFGYDANDRLVSVTDGSRTLLFGYAAGRLVSYTNARGKETTYAYDSAGANPGALVSKTLPNGNVRLLQAFNGGGQVSSQTDALGNAVTLVYAPGSTTGTYPGGGARVHDYDEAGNLTGFTDEAGNTATHTYDASNRQTQATDRLGGVTLYTYHAPSGKLASVQQPDGATTQYGYSTRSVAGFELFDPTTITYPDLTSDTHVFNPDGTLAQRTDRAGNVWAFTYNANGQVLTRTNPTGGTRTYTYNPDGTIATLTLGGIPTAVPITFGYDGLKRLTTITHADAAVRTYGWNENDDVVSITNERGKTTSFEYDDNDNLIKIVDPLLNEVNITYDAMDRVVSVSDRLGRTVQRTYDIRGRLATVTDRDGNVTRFAYDAVGRLASVTDGNAKVWSRGYDAESVLAFTENPLGLRANFESDPMGRIDRMESPAGGVVTMSYDSMGRLASLVDPAGESAAFQYDANGLMSGAEVEDGTVNAGYQRNALGLITAVTDANGNDWLRGHDAQGRVASVTDPLGNQTGYTFDDRGRVSLAALPGGGTMDVTHDPGSNIVRRLYSDGTDLQYTFDDLDRLVGADGLALAYDANDNIIDSNGLLMSRDPNGRIATLTLAPGRQVSYEYDGRNQLARVTDWQGGITALGYDDAARLVSVTRPNGVDTSYTYDDDGFLVAIAEGTVSNIALTRDRKGRVLAATRNTPTPAGAGTPMTAAWTYNAASEVGAFSYDGLGRLTDDGTRQYTWNLASQLTTIQLGATTTTMTYDGMGYRATRSAGGATRRHVWNYALRLPAVNVERSGAGADRTYYVTTPGGSLLYSIDAQSGARTDYHYDEAGNTLFLTDTTGTVTASYAYRPYGRRVASTGGGANPFTWQGKWGVMDDGDGLYYMRARYYDGTTGRFLSRDPIASVEPKKVNPYQYAKDNPNLYIDPSGLDALSVLRRYIEQLDTGTPSNGRGSEYGDLFNPLVNRPDPFGFGSTTRAPCTGGCSTSCITGRTTHSPLCGNRPDPYPNGTIIIAAEAGDASFSELPSHYRTQIRRLGYDVITVDSYQVGRGEHGLSPEQLTDVTGFLSIGHSCGNHVAGINRANLNILLNDIATAKNDTSAGLTALGFWGCKSWHFYESGAGDFRAHLGSGAAVFGYGTSAAVNPFKTGFGTWVTADPFLRHLENGTPGEYEITDVLGGTMDALP